MAVDGVLLPNCVVLCCVNHAYDNDLCVPRDTGLKDLGSDEEAIGRLNTDCGECIKCATTAQRISESIGQSVGR